MPPTVADGDALIEALQAIARSLESIAEEIGALRDALPSEDRLINALRTDHPLQGETFGALESALERIAEKLEDGLGSKDE